MSELKKGNRVLSPKGMGTVSYVAKRVTCTEVDVVMDGSDLTRTFLEEELEVLDYQIDRDLNDSHEVWIALNFIHQLRQRGDEPGNMMAEILEPLAEAYATLKEERDLG